MAILCGRGGNFCAGYDLKALATYTRASINSVLGNYGEGPAPMVSLFRRIQYNCSLRYNIVGSHPS